jgi:serine/threonine protein kinase
MGSGSRFQGLHNTINQHISAFIPMQVSVRTQTELVAALNDPAANMIVMKSPIWNFTDKEIPEHAAVLRGRTVILEGVNQPDGSLMYIDGNQLTSRVLITEGAQLLQRNFWVDDCFISSFPYTCFSFAAGGGSRIEFRDSIFSDARCMRWSESNGITAMVNTAKFVKPLTFKTQELDERRLHVEDTGWVPFVPPTAYWRLVNVTLSCTGNITHELPADFVVFKDSSWGKKDFALLVTILATMAASLWWMLGKGYFSPPQEVHIARKKGFELINELGYGRFGKVYRARHRSSSKIVAVKVINLKPTDWKQLRAAWRECQLMSKVKHSSCIKVITYYSARITPYSKQDSSSDSTADDLKHIKHRPAANTAVRSASPPLNSGSDPSHPSSGDGGKFGIYEVTAALNEFAANSLSGSRLLAAAEEVLTGRTPFTSTIIQTGSITPPDFRNLDRRASPGNSNNSNAATLVRNSGGGDGGEEPTTTTDWSSGRNETSSDPEDAAAGLSLESLVLQVHLVMEFADQGTLQERVTAGVFKNTSPYSSASAAANTTNRSPANDSRKLPNISHVIDTALDIARGLATLHSPAHRMVHRDLSPNNVLLISEFNERGFRAVLSDFGLTTVVALGATHKTSEARGTLAYMPPELLENSVVSTGVDIYSLGILIVFMLSGSEPYDRMNAGNIITHKLTNGDNQIPIPSMLRGINDQRMFELLNLVRQCTYAGRRERPTAEDVVSVLERLTG